MPFDPEFATQTRAWLVKAVGGIRVAAATVKGGIA